MIGSKMNLLLRLPISRQLLILTVDTGAESSLLRPHKLEEETQVDTGRSSAFIGLGRDNPVRSIGTISTNFQINNLNFPMEFHLMDCELCQSSDGILGNDFLIKYQSIIDYSTNTISFTTKSSENELHENGNPLFKSHDKGGKRKNAYYYE